jgi:hypothetical protein
VMELSLYHCQKYMWFRWKDCSLFIFVSYSWVVFFLCRGRIYKPLRLRLQSPKPSFHNSSDTVKVTLVLDPQCKYSVRWDTVSNMCLLAVDCHVWVRLKNWAVDKWRNQAGWCSDNILDLWSVYVQFRSVPWCKSISIEATWKIWK